MIRQDVPDYAPGTQKNVSGEVIRWNNVSGPEKIDAKKYIELLEAEIEELNRQVGRKTANGQNELLEYLKSLEPQNLKVKKVNMKTLMFPHRNENVLRLNNEGPSLDEILAGWGKILRRLVSLNEWFHDHLLTPLFNSQVFYNKSWKWDITICV